MGFGDDCVWWHCVIVVSYNEANSILHNLLRIFLEHIVVSDG